MQDLKVSMLPERKENINRIPRLAIVSSHPIQYNAPWFRLLAERGNVNPKVFYTWSQSEEQKKYDPDFQKVIAWDIPLLDGYDYEFVENTAKEPGSHHFRGIRNPGLLKAIQSFRPDAVLVIGWAFESHLRCMRFFKGRIPVLFRGDSTLLDETKGLKKMLRRIFLTWVYRHLDKALYVGTNNKNYFIAHGVKESQLILAFHAIDNERFGDVTNRTREILALRKKLNIRPNDFTVLFAGKLEPKKNPFFLFELSKFVTDNDLVFLIVGNGQLEQQLKQDTSQDERFRFLDFQNQTQMPAVYGAAQVFILPSKGPGETWGLAVNEAMACALPVMVSEKAGGAVDLVDGNGVIFSAGEIEKAADFLRRLKHSPALYQTASAASLERVKHFSFQQIAKAVEKACTS